MAADELRHRRLALGLLGSQLPGAEAKEGNEEEMADGRGSSRYAHDPVDQLRDGQAARYVGRPHHKGKTRGGKSLPQRACAARATTVRRACLACGNSSPPGMRRLEPAQLPV